MSAKPITSDLQNVYDLAIKYLNVIFLDNRTMNLLKTDKAFVKVVENNIKIVSMLENEYDLSPKNTDRFVNSLGVLTKVKVNLNGNKTMQMDNVELLDTVNYTNVYVNNALKISIDDIYNASFNKSKANEQNTADVKEEYVEEVEPRQYQSDEDILRRSGYTMHEVADQLVASQAQILLNNNIAKNKVYIYNSKPILIPILKILSIILMVTIFVLSIAVFAILVQKNGQLVIASGNDAGKAAQIVSPFPFSLIMNFMVLMFITTSMVRGWKNDNNRYRFSWGWMAFYLVIFLMGTIFTNYQIVFNLDGYGNIFSNFNDHKGAFETARALQIAILAIVGALVGITITAAFFNPKRDMKRIEKLLLQYMDQIRNGTIDSSKLGGGSMFGMNGPFGPNNWF